MALDGKNAKRVAQFFADVFTDMLECAAAKSVSVVRFVVDQRAWELRRQRRALSPLLFLGRRWRCLQCLELSLNRRDIDQIVQQAGLLRI